jgi:hypothetical protein
MAFTNFRKTKGLRELSYAPQGFDALTPEVFNDDTYLKDFVSKVIEFQVCANVLIAPFTLILLMNGFKLTVMEAIDVNANIPQ